MVDLDFSCFPSDAHSFLLTQSISYALFTQQALSLSSYRHAAESEEVAGLTPDDVELLETCASFDVCVLEDVALGATNFKLIPKQCVLKDVSISLERCSVTRFILALYFPLMFSARKTVLRFSGPASYSFSADGHHDVISLHYLKTVVFGSVSAYVNTCDLQVLSYSCIDTSCDGAFAFDRATVEFICAPKFKKKRLDSYSSFLDATVAAVPISLSYGKDTKGMPHHFRSFVYAPHSLHDELQLMLTHSLQSFMSDTCDVSSFPCIVHMLAPRSAALEGDDEDATVNSNAISCFSSLHYGDEHSTHVFNPVAYGFSCTSFDSSLDAFHICLQEQLERVKTEICSKTVISSLHASLLFSFLLFDAHIFMQKNTLATCALELFSLFFAGKDIEKKKNNVVFDS